MKIGRRSASQRDHADASVAGSTAGDADSATSESAPQRDGDDPLGQLVLVADGARLEVATRGGRAWSQRELERPQAWALDVELDAEPGAAKMDAEGWDAVGLDGGDLNLAPD